MILHGVVVFLVQRSPFTFSYFIFIFFCPSLYLSFYLTIFLSFLFLSFLFFFFNASCFHFIHTLFLYLLTFIHPSVSLYSFLFVGMGGSSVLAAAVLSAVSTLLGSKLDKERLIHLVSQVEQGSGSDSDNGRDSLLIFYLNNL